METSDRELLELAAKAAGIDTATDPFGELRNVSGLPAEFNIYAAPPWNPLTDDGDALRLAVKLNLSFQSYPLWDRAQAWHPGRPEIAPEEPHRDDPCAATRRAIVRAAAEIGRKMG